MTPPTPRGTPDSEARCACFDDPDACREAVRAVMDLVAAAGLSTVAWPSGFAGDVVCQVLTVLKRRAASREAGAPQ